MVDIIKKNFGEALKSLRKKRGFTQEVLSEKIGINLRQLARIEAGESFVTSETLFSICTSLRISPWELFNFNIETELLMTGTDNVVYLKAIKDEVSTKIFTKEQTENIISSEKSLSDDFDSKMIKMSKKLNKEIVVDEIINCNEVCTKIFKPNGEVLINYKNKFQKEYEELKMNIAKISNDKMKIEFLNLALKALSNNESLKELKILIRGIELMQQ